jgi:hypothetical protein
MVRDYDQLLNILNINLNLEDIYNEKILKKIVSVILIITAISFILGMYSGIFTSTYGKILELIIILVFFYFLIWLMGIRCKLSGCKKEIK